MIAIGIIGVLSAVGIPAYQNYNRRAIESKTEANLKLLYRSVNTLRASGESDVSGQLPDFVKGIPSPTYTASGNNWCVHYEDESIKNEFQTSGDSGSVCINQNGAVFRAGNSVKCSFTLDSDLDANGNQSTCTGHTTCTNVQNPTDSTCTAVTYSSTSDYTCTSGTCS